MAVFFTAASYYKRSDFVKNPQKQTACQLGEKVELPYFKQFDEERLSLESLYKLIDEQIENCLTQAGWQKSELSQIPIFLGSTGYVIADCEARLLTKQPLPEVYSLAVISDYLRSCYQTEVFSLATSCTASAQGIYFAAQMLEQGLCNKALVVGFEPFNRLTFEHFHAMHLLAENWGEQGIVLGEGLGCVALGCSPNVAFPCELLGAESYTDFENLTNNSEQALQALIQRILVNSSLSKTQISLVKPHRVGGNFDETENTLLQKHFPTAKRFLAKSYFGHTLGANGVLETALLWEILQKNRENQPLAATEYTLSYFLGFGGSNVGWVLKS